MILVVTLFVVLMLITVVGCHSDNLQARGKKHMRGE